jgi:hypothetical protein
MPFQRTVWVSTMNCLRKVFPVLTVFATLATTVAWSQTTAEVSVDINRHMNPLTREAVGAYTQLSDGNYLSPTTIDLLRVGGFGAITYPSGWESAADSYHWATNSLTPHPGNADAPQKPFLAPGNDFGHLVFALEKTPITPFIIVNYGSNLRGTGGGEPVEAAAWVAFANGDPASKQPLGKDSSGADWKTVGFWAGLRAGTPLPTDDGYNFLRVNHPESLHIQLWQVGEDVPENGFYGGEHKGTLDLHAPYPEDPKDNEKRRKLKELSPATYGQHVVEYVTAMKAVDPKIEVGADLTTPGIDQYGPEWNGEVLRAACKDVDFVSFPWLPGNTLPPDWKQLDEGSVLAAPQNDLPKIISEMLYEDRRFCPGGKVPRVVLSRFAPIPWGLTKATVVKALFAADAYAALAEAGIANADWYQLREGGLLDANNKPLPAYFGAQMFHIVAFRPGDMLLGTHGSSATLAVHAAHRQDGLYTVMLVNKDAQTSVHVKVSLAGANLAGNGISFLYGPGEAAKGTGPVRGDVKADGSVVSVDVPAYSIVDVILPEKR